MIHSHHRAKYDPERRAQMLSRILDPEYTGQSGQLSSKSFRTRSPSLPRASVFVDRYGDQHDPDFRPFGSYPAVTPMEEPSAWPWYADDDDNDEPRSISRGPTSFPSGHTLHSATSSSYHSSILSYGSGSASGSAYGSRSRSASALPTPPLEPERPMTAAQSESHIGRKLSPPTHIPRSALFPWTPAQRAVRVQHEINRRNVVPPPSFLEEEPEQVPLTLVDSRYVPGYGHFSSPGPSSPPSRPQTVSESHAEHKDEKHTCLGRIRAHTAPSPTTTTTTTKPPEEDQEPDPPISPSSTHSFRQSVYSFGLRTKLGLHHMKDRIRRASGAAKRPLSL
ncbi:unnamed protein product [Rhizoctonia solani]|uniref:Uncharacterized protein n=1 Tax=Rhizoctonia solani TaxID=456999 RepID=A0A8H2XAG7_9AGAM|nr:unnamed protein product [Rhizoctonia solani]